MNINKHVIIILETIDISYQTLENNEIMIERKRIDKEEE